MITSAGLITSILLFLAGLFLACWMIFSIASPFFGTFSGFNPFVILRPGFNERWRFRRRKKALIEVDEAIKGERFDQAKSLIPRALFLDVIRQSPELLAESAHHHTDLLNQLINLSDRLGVTLRTLPTLEGLFLARTDVYRKIFETRNARLRLSKKREEKGKSTPAWSMKEYDEKLTGYYDELDTNSFSIEKQLKETLDEFNYSSEAHNDTNYH